jgi:hypothetical protein
LNHYRFTGAHRVKRGDQRGKVDGFYYRIDGFSIVSFLTRFFYGTLTMGLAFALLAFAFLIIVGGTFAVGHLWKTTKTHKAIVAAIAAICLFLIGIYEWRNFTPPLTATDIATAVVDKIKTTPANGSETPSSSPHAVQPSIVAPEALPSGPIGVLLDNSDHITFSGSSIESSGTAVVARNSSDITFGKAQCYDPFFPCPHYRMAVFIRLYCR